MLRVIAKRLRRICWNGLTLLSLLILGATAAFWAQSYSYADYFYFDTEAGISGSASSEPGKLRLALVQRRCGTDPRDCGFSATRFSQYSHSPDVWTSHILFLLSRDPDDHLLVDEQGSSSEWFGHGSGDPLFRLYGTPSPAFRYAHVRLPYWSILVASAILPTIRLARRMQRRWRRRSGLCPVCSYDLRATPERCPECGCVPDDQS